MFLAKEIFWATLILSLYGIHTGIQGLTKLFIEEASSLIRVAAII